MINSPRCKSRKCEVPSLIDQIDNFIDYCKVKFKNKEKTRGNTGESPPPRVPQTSGALVLSGQCDPTLFPSGFKGPPIGSSRSEVVGQFSCIYTGEGVTMNRDVKEKTFYLSS